MPHKLKAAESSQDLTLLVAVMKDIMAMQQCAMLNQQQAVADQQQAHVQEIKLLRDATAYVHVGDGCIPDRQNTPETSSVSAPKFSVKQSQVLSESTTLWDSRHGENNGMITTSSHILIICEFVST